jgi:CRISPR/Cas system-associated exonuclease Cas4 (RecB family)
LVIASWKENLLNRKELIELAKGETTKFRTGMSTIPASSIAQQYYCEMKVEQDYIHGEVQTEAKDEGTNLHDNLLAMRKSTIEKIIKGIEKKEILVASFPLVAKFEGLTLAGVPDAIVFQKSKLAYVIELKTTARGDTTIVYDDQRAQTFIYGLLLELMGFDCSNLKLIIVRYKTSAPLSIKNKSKFLGILVQSLITGSADSFAPKSKNGIVAHTLSYAKLYAVQAIREKKGYWLNEREPIPTMNPNKCKACEFANLCPSSLAKANSTSASRDKRQASLAINAWRD